jgi:cysteine desulfuration protein SufE
LRQICFHSFTAGQCDILAPMNIPDTYLRKPSHRELLEEILSLDTAEDRLSYLMERQPIHVPLAAEMRIDSRKVPGCLSGLWLHGVCVDGVCSFSACSESSLVQGVVSFLCDLYGDRSPEEIIAIGDLIARAVNLDGLLSVTRKRATSSTLTFILHTATQHLSPQQIAS